MQNNYESISRRPVLNKNERKGIFVIGNSGSGGRIIGKLLLEVAIIEFCNLMIEILTNVNDADRMKALAKA
jgi:hypothetical protein